MTTTPLTITNTVQTIEDLEQLIQRVKQAQAAYATFPQAKVDKIFKQAALKANQARIPLAKFAVEETGMGVEGSDVGIAVGRAVGGIEGNGVGWTVGRGVGIGVEG